MPYLVLLRLISVIHAFFAGVTHRIKSSGTRVCQFVLGSADPMRTRSPSVLCVKRFEGWRSMSVSFLLSSLAVLESLALQCRRSEEAVLTVFNSYRVKDS